MIKRVLTLVNAMHITASVFINDDERGLHQDYDDWLEELAPHEPISRYRHNRTGEDNGDAHLKRQVMGREVVVAITDGGWTTRLSLRAEPQAEGSSKSLAPGSRSFEASRDGWPASLDGRRRKRVLVKIIGE